MRTAVQRFAAAAATLSLAAATALAQVPPAGAPPERSPFPPRQIAPVPPPPGRPGQTPPDPVVEDLGDGRYRIGAITIDKPRQQFSVPGRVLQLATPSDALEFLVIAKDGHKAYESAVMVETDAIAFNVACILIGLDATGASQPRQHFDPRPVEGAPVTVTVSWQAKGRTITKPISSLLRVSGGEAASDDWVYTGSYFFPDGRYAALDVGTLVGFVHDRDSIIQHRTGLGLGNYGAITYGGPEAPPAGTPVIVSVAKAAR